MFKTILFDNNGVITYSDNEVTVQKVADYLKMDPEELRPVFHEEAKPMDQGLITTEKFYRRIAEHFNKQYNIDELMKVVRDCYEPRPGMKDYLLELKNEYEIALLTNFGDIFDELNEKTWHFEEIFGEKNLFVSAKLKMIKPNKDIYLYALEKLGNKPEEVVFVDDREPNLVPANDLGMKTIHFKDVEQCKNELKSILEEEKTKV